MIELSTACRATLVLVGLVVMISVVATHLELVKIEKRAPEVLLEAGIREIDWWFRCMFGISMLAFGAPGIALPARSKAIFRTSVVSSIVFFTALMLCLVLAM